MRGRAPAAWFARLALGLAAGAGGGCAISTQQEVALGADYAAQVEADLPVVHDAAIDRYLNALGNQLARVTDTRNLAWKFAVVNSADVNAFALPGGWIYVNRGLIDRAEDMSQLAGVLGHEIGHVTLRHSVEQMQQAQGATVGLVLTCTLTRICESGTGQTAINLGGTALFAKFSRSDEAEADAEAVRTTIKAGIDPNGIPRMFRILLNEREGNPSALDAFFATHPLAEDRITATAGQIATYPPGDLRGLTRDTPEFRTFQRRVRALPAPPKGK